MNANRGTPPALFGSGVAIGGGAIAAPQGAVAKSGRPTVVGGSGKPMVGAGDVEENALTYQVHIQPVQAAMHELLYWTSKISMIVMIHRGRCSRLVISFNNESL